ncbi:MAG: hypothetical protein RRX88_06395 [Raoultibacter sp.]
MSDTAKNTSSVSNLSLNFPSKALTSLIVRVVFEVLWLFFLSLSFPVLTGLMADAADWQILLSSYGLSVVNLPDIGWTTIMVPGIALVFLAYSFSFDFINLLGALKPSLQMNPVRPGKIHTALFWLSAISFAASGITHLGCIASRYMATVPGLEIENAIAANQIMAICAEFILPSVLASTLLCCFFCAKGVKSTTANLTNRMSNAMRSHPIARWAFLVTSIVIIGVFAPLLAIAAMMMFSVVLVIVCWGGALILFIALAPIVLTAALRSN